MQRLLVITLLLAFSYYASPSADTLVMADDWPQWRGLQRDAIWRETGIVAKIPVKDMPVKWKVPVNLGYSGPAIADGRVFLTDYSRASGDLSNDGNNRRVLEGTERIICLDSETGKEIWQHSYPCHYKIGYPSGPRATPTVNSGKVYALGAEGALNCLDTKNGDVIWSKDLRKEYSQKTPIWGFCGSPLVEGNKLICLVGGPGSVIVAFDKDTGAELWKALKADTGYSSPSMIEAGGVRQLIVWHTDALCSLNPENGESYWTIPLKAGYTMSIMTPQKHGDYLFASSNGTVAALLKLDSTKPAAEVVWRGAFDNAVYACNVTPIIDETGTLYGVDCGGGQLRAIELATGKRLWETFAATTGTRFGKYGTAHIVRNGNRYFLFSETGDLILAHLSAEGYNEIGRFHLIDPTGECLGRDVAWAHPAFANKCVFARSDKEIVCVSLAEEE